MMTEQHGVVVLFICVLVMFVVIVFVLVCVLAAVAVVVVVATMTKCACFNPPLQSGMSLLQVLLSRHAVHLATAPSWKM